MTDEEKIKSLREWEEGYIHVIVATNAFSMGITKRNVRFVIHTSIPMNLEAY